jgi:hypothetical protein
VKSCRFNSLFNAGTLFLLGETEERWPLLWSVKDVLNNINHVFAGLLICGLILAMHNGLGKASDYHIERTNDVNDVQLRSVLFVCT